MAIESVIEIIQLSVPVTRIEFMDEHQVEACNRYSGLNKPVAPTLFFEFQGSEAETQEQVARVRSVLSDQGASDFDWATRPEDRNRLWKARHNALAAAKNLRAGAEVFITDVAVPISRLADCIKATREDIDATNLCAPIVGHVGDGNFHVFFVINPDDEVERRQVTALHDRLVRRAIDMDGTCTAEHGIGLGKKEHLEHELGEEAVDVMRAIKRSLDPKGLLNPGKIFD
jgi:D-lactate dehydrogenase (cytochrome)